MQQQQGISKFFGLTGLCLALQTTYQFIYTGTQLTMQSNNPMNGMPVQVTQFHRQPVNVFDKPSTLWHNDTNSPVYVENVVDFSTHFQQPFENTQWPQCPPHVCPQCPKCPPYFCPECPILNRSSTEHLNQCVYDLSAYITGIVYSFIQWVVLWVSAVICQMFRFLMSTTKQKQDGQLPRVNGPIDFGNLVVQLLATAVCNQILCDYSATLLSYQRQLQQNWTGLCVLMFILVCMGYLAFTLKRFYNRHQFMQELQEHLDILVYLNMRHLTKGNKSKNAPLLYDKCKNENIEPKVIEAFTALVLFDGTGRITIEWNLEWDTKAQILAGFLDQSHRLLVQVSTKHFITETYKINMYMAAFWVWQITRLDIKRSCIPQMNADGSEKLDENQCQILTDLPIPGLIALKKVLNNMWAMINSTDDKPFPAY
jgi:hypothetical protein